METLAPSFSVSRLADRREVHYELNGLFTMDEVESLFAELRNASQPFIEDRKGFRVIGDLRQLAVQTREVAEKIKYSQESSARAGVDKMAIVYTSTLLMQQFRRASDALECEFFTDKAEALRWLRTF